MNQSYKIIVWLIFLLLNVFDASSQLIESAEYFFDKDPGIGSGKPLIIQYADSVSTLFGISTASLTNGFHQLFIRVKNSDNKWSIAEQRPLYVDGYLQALQPLNSAEYFFDEDPGVGKGYPLSIPSADSANTSFNISSAGLSNGFHHLFIRVKNNSNKWSISEAGELYIDNNAITPPAPIVSGEYFIDNDAGTGKNTAVQFAKGDSIEATYSYTASDLSFGKHTMNLRVKDSLGRWSYVESRSFTVCATYGAAAAFTYTIIDTVVQFTNTSEYATSYHWNFGDGDTSALANPVHAYKAGTYNACLISKNDCLPEGDTLCSVITVTKTLPITLLDFQAFLQQNDCILNWQTASEQNSSYYNIQRSIDGRIFNTLGKLAVRAAGNSNSIKSYSYTDRNVTALNKNILYYRLQEVDKDGSITLSKIQTVKLSNADLSFVVAPNPIHQVFTIYSRINASNVLITIADITGKMVYSTKQNCTVGGSIKLYTGSFANGTFIVNIKTGSGINTYKVVKE